MAEIISLFDLRLFQISRIKWGSAAAWDESCDSLLREYYSRILEWWPPERLRFPPNDQVILKQLSAAVALSDSILDSYTLHSELLKIRKNGIRLERATVDLLKVVLNFAIAIDNKSIDVSSDPGLPLLELFEKGYQIGYTDAGIEIHYQEGWKILPVPLRTEVVLYMIDGKDA
ncbi:hypothetical protein [Dyadobacter psychrophilus]|uniref:Uncharacterized protein n=1 Tax=Dyadobacter psychrophilus TaxID=651661 RepID=A0A1T5H7G7_9BACT|nr:hypothetical protein [Dyadobacter psychrophilus]SKC16490.1 hypothetical protein SAMN05660293_04982 [Dyadobacter psychrophilus]